MDERIILPPKYYHDNFDYLLKFVTDKYKNLILPHEWAFLHKYDGLPEDAQCLFIRFTNRKGLFFKLEGLKYDELENIPELVNLLKKENFISMLSAESHVSFLQEILNVPTKPELIKFFDLQKIKNEKREILFEFILENFSAETLIELVNHNIQIVKINFELEVAFLKFLFFGNKMMDMTEFVLRDLGLIQYYKLNDDDLVARFENRKEAEDKWFVSDQFLIFENLKKTVSESEIFDWFLTMQFSNTNLSEIAMPSFQKLALRIAKFFEQKKAFDFAIQVYDKIVVSPSRERKARCLVKTGMIEEAKELCTEMINQPQNVDEEYFAEYFIKTLEGKKSKKKTTEWLASADEITISKMYRNQVELGAIDYYYMEHGFDAGFSENHTWRTLFGLWFWDIIFDSSLVAFHHPFQRRPSDLHLPDFFIKRKTQIENKLAEFDGPNELLLALRNTFVKNIDTANPFVVWLDEVWEMVYVMVTKIDLSKIKAVMYKIAENLVENSRGLPDLLVWSENHYEFVEIKSPNDTLSHQQLFWLKYFKEIELNAKVLRVKFD